MKDWIGNSRSAHATLGARNYAQNERETFDYYATEPKALELLLEKESFSNNIWECACGEGHLSKVLVSKGYSVRSTDLYRTLVQYAAVLYKAQFPRILRGGQQT